MKHTGNKTSCEYTREGTKRRQTIQLASDEMKELSFRSWNGRVNELGSIPKRSNDTWR